MGSRLGHAAGVATRAQAAGAATEADQEVVAAAGAAGRGEALSQDAAVQVLAEGPLHVGRDRGNLRVALASPGQECFQVLAQEAVKRAFLRATAAVDGWAGRAAGRACEHGRPAIKAWAWGGS